MVWDPSNENILSLPNGDLLRFPAGVTIEQARDDAIKNYSDQFDIPSGLLASMGSTWERMKGAAAAAPDVTLGALGDREKLIRRAQDTYAKAGEEAREYLPDPTTTEDISEAWKEEGFFPAAAEAWTFATEAIGQSVPYMGPGLVAGKIGASDLVAKTSLGRGVASALSKAIPALRVGASVAPSPLIKAGLGAVAGMGTLALQFYADNLQRQVEVGGKDVMPDDISVFSAGAAAIPQAGMEYLFIALMGGIGGGPQRAAAQSISQSLALGSTSSGRKALSVTSRTALESLTEFPTELAQTVLERAQAGESISLEDAEFVREMWETVAGTIPVAGVFGAAGTYRAHRADKVSQKEWDRMSAKEKESRDVSMANRDRMRAEEEERATRIERENVQRWEAAKLAARRNNDAVGLAAIQAAENMPVTEADVIEAADSRNVLITGESFKAFIRRQTDGRVSSLKDTNNQERRKIRSVLSGLKVYEYSDAKGGVDLPAFSEEQLDTAIEKTKNAPVLNQSVIRKALGLENTKLDKHVARSVLKQMERRGYAKREAKGAKRPLKPTNPGYSEAEYKEVIRLSQEKGQVTQGIVESVTDNYGPDEYQKFLQSMRDRKDLREGEGERVGVYVPRSLEDDRIDGNSSFVGDVGVTVQGEKGYFVKLDGEIISGSTNRKEALREAAKLRQRSRSYSIVKNGQVIKTLKNSRDAKAALENMKTTDPGANWKFRSNPPRQFTVDTKKTKGFRVVERSVEGGKLRDVSELAFAPSLVLAEDVRDKRIDDMKPHGKSDWEIRKEPHRKQAEIELKKFLSETKGVQFEAPPREDFIPTPDPAIEQRNQEVLGIVRENLEQAGLGGDVLARVVNRIGSRGVGIEGEFDPNVYTISVALEQIAEAKTPEQVRERVSGIMDHEMVHAMRGLDLFTENEWAALQNATARVVDSHGRAFLDTALEKYEGVKGYETRESKIEEAVAEMYRQYHSDPNVRQQLDGEPVTLMERVQRFLEKMFNAFTGIGFADASDVFRGIDIVQARDRGTVRTLKDTSEESARNRVLVRREEEKRRNLREKKEGKKSKKYSISDDDVWTQDDLEAAADLYKQDTGYLEDEGLTSELGEGFSVLDETGQALSDDEIEAPRVVPGDSVGTSGVGDIVASKDAVKGSYSVSLDPGVLIPSRSELLVSASNNFYQFLEYMRTRGLVNPEGYQDVDSLTKDVMPFIEKTIDEYHQAISEIADGSRIIWMDKTDYIDFVSRHLDEGDLDIGERESFTDENHPALKSAGVGRVSAIEAESRESPGSGRASFVVGVGLKDGKIPVMEITPSEVGTYTGLGGGFEFVASILDAGLVSRGEVGSDVSTLMAYRYGISTIEDLKGGGGSVFKEMSKAAYPEWGVASSVGDSGWIDRLSKFGSDVWTIIGAEIDIKAGPISGETYEILQRGLIDERSIHTQLEMSLGNFSFPNVSQTRDHSVFRGGNINTLINKLSDDPSQRWDIGDLDSEEFFDWMRSRIDDLNSSGEGLSISSIAEFSGNPLMSDYFQQGVNYYIRPGKVKTFIDTSVGQAGSFGEEFGEFITGRFRVVQISRGDRDEARSFLQEEYSKNLSLIRANGVGKVLKRKGGGLENIEGEFSLEGLEEPAVLPRLLETDQRKDIVNALMPGNLARFIFPDAEIVNTDYKSNGLPEYFRSLGWFFGQDVEDVGTRFSPTSDAFSPKTIKYRLSPYLKYLEYKGLSMKLGHKHGENSGKPTFDTDFAGVFLTLGWNDAVQEWVRDTKEWGMNGANDDLSPSHYFDEGSGFAFFSVERFKDALKRRGELSEESIDGFIQSINRDFSDTDSVAKYNENIRPFIEPDTGNPASEYLDAYWSQDSFRSGNYHEGPLTGGIPRFIVELEQIDPTPMFEKEPLKRTDISWDDRVALDDARDRLGVGEKSGRFSIVDVDKPGWQKVGHQAGSNEGGFYQNEVTGEEYYVKTPHDPNIARNEVLAAKLYQAAGVQVPDVDLGILDGTESVASRIVPGLERDEEALRRGDVAGVAEGFVADAWLGNWDVVGLEFDNLLVKDNEAYRIDTGGSLIYRAQGGLKNDLFEGAWGPVVSELQTLRGLDPNVQNDNARDTFRYVTDENIVKGIDKIVAIPLEKIQALVDSFGPLNLRERTELVSMLEQRRNYLAGVRLELAGENAKPAFYESLVWEDKGNERQETVAVNAFPVRDAIEKVSQSTNEAGMFRDTRIVEALGNFSIDRRVPFDASATYPAAWGDINPEERNSFGVAVMDRNGNVVLREVANHFDGYHWSFAKGRMDEGETPLSTAVRELQEETGIGLDTPGFKIVGALPGKYASGYSNTYFYVAEIDGAFPEVRPDWVDPGADGTWAEQLMDETPGFVPRVSTRAPASQDARPILREHPELTERSRAIARGDIKPVKLSVGNASRVELDRDSARTRGDRNYEELRAGVSPPFVHKNLWDYIRAIWEDPKLGLAWLRQKFVDKYEGIRRISEAAALKRGDAYLLADVNALSQAYLSDRAVGIVEEALVAGVPVMKGGIARTDTTKKGLMEILGPLFDGDVDLMRDWHLWMIMNREFRFDNEGKRVQTTAEERETINRTVRENGWLETFEEVNRNYQEFNEAVVDFMRDTGVINEGMAEVFKSTGDYIPFFREFDGTADQRLTAAMQEYVGEELALLEAQGRIPATSGNQRQNAPSSMFTSLTGARPPKPAKGGEGMTVDPLTGILKNLQAAVTSGMKNVAAVQVMKDAVEVDMAVPSDEKTNATHTVRENGEDKHYIVYDELLHDSLVGMLDGRVKYLNFFAAPATFLREMVTRSPDFIVANLLRDSISTWVTSGVSTGGPIGTMKNFLSGGISSGEGIESYEALKGAGVIGGYDFGRDITDFRKTFDKRLREQGLSDGKRSGVWSMSKKLWNWSGDVTTKSDAATRMAVYEDVLQRTLAMGYSREQAESEAIFQALEVINFGRRGNSTAAKIITSVIPFLNARVQGLDVLWRAGRGRYSADRSAVAKKRAMIGFLSRGSLLAFSTFAYAALFHDEEEWKNARPEEKDDNWIIPGFGDMPGFKIPIPFEVGVIFKTIPERFYRYMVGEQDERQTVNALKRSLVTTFEFNLFGPQITKPVMEAMMNYSFFTGRDIVPFYMEDYKGSDQYNVKTNEFAKTIGQAFNVSPMKLEHILRGYTGTLGSYILTTADYAMRKLPGATPRPTLRVDQFVMARRFLQSVEGAEGQAAEWYDFTNAAKSITGAFSKRITDGDIAGARKIYEKNKDVFAIDAIRRNVDKQMDRLRKMQTQILLSPQLDEDRKLDIINRLDHQRKILLSQRQGIINRANLPIELPSLLN